jgi:hypothetical protein
LGERGLSIEKRIDKTEKKVEAIETILKHGDEQTFVCLQEDSSKRIEAGIAENRESLIENRQGQQTILEKIKGLSQNVEAFKDSQKRMFDFMKKLDIKVDEQSKQLEKGHERFITIENELGKKELTNGYRDKAIENLGDLEKELKEEINKKASKEELEKLSKDTNEKLDLVLTSQEDFNGKLYRMFTVFFIVIGGIVGLLTLILKM